MCPTARPTGDVPSQANWLVRSETFVGSFSSSSFLLLPPSPSSAAPLLLVIPVSVLGSIRCCFSTNPLLLSAPGKGEAPYRRHGSARALQGRDLPRFIYCVGAHGGLVLCAAASPYSKDTYGLWGRTLWPHSSKTVAKLLAP